SVGEGFRMRKRILESTIDLYVSLRITVGVSRSYLSFHNYTPRTDKMTSPLRVGVVFISILAACTLQKPVVDQLDPHTMPVTVRSSVKAHLFDGSTVIYPHGVYVANNAVIGVGRRYSVGSSMSTNVTRLSLDSIVGMEAYSKD